MLKTNALIVSILILSFVCRAQTDLSNLFDSGEPEVKKVFATFKTSRLVNAHTIEQIKKNELDFRISHRFDDIGGDFGGISTLYGFDNVSDIRIGFEYGITDELMVAFGRSKGGYTSGPKQVLDGFLKYRLLTQKTKGMPVSISLMALTELATQKKTDNTEQINSFPEGAHRLSYSVQAIIARKFSRYLSLQIIPTYIHRNFVLFGDENDNFALGFGGRIKITKRMAIIFDYFALFSEYRDQQNADDNINLKFYNPLGVGLEIETGGHVFHLNFSNSAGIIETQYIPYTNKAWMDGGFRFGFNISRVFAL